MEELLDYNSENFGEDNKYRTVEDVIANGYELSIGEAIKGGWDLAISKIWYFIGFMFLYALISIFISFIPFLGMIASLIISPPLTAGFALFCYKLANKESVSFSNFFDGFKEKMWPLVINNLLISLIIILSVLPLLGIIGFTVFELVIDGGTSDPNAILELIKQYGVLLFLYILVISSLFVLVIQHTNILLFQNKSPWESIKSSILIVKSKYFTYIGLFFILYLINILGILCLIIGVIVTISVSICTMYYTYELTFKKK